MKNLFIIPAFLISMTLFASNPSINSSDVTSPNAKTTVYEVSTFCKLIQMGNYDAVKSLIENGTDVNRKSNGLTPLMFAARHNRADIAKLLIVHGAKINTKCNGLCALDLAKKFNAKETYKVIEEALR